VGVEQVGELHDELLGVSLLADLPDLGVGRRGEVALSHAVDNVLLDRGGEQHVVLRHNPHTNTPYTYSKQPKPQHNSVNISTCNARI